MARLWPTRSRRASSPGFAAMSVSTFRPYLRAIIVGVSPALTMWLREAGAAAVAGRLGESGVTVDGLVDVG